MRLPMNKTCPYCGSTNVDCDMTDIGVGMLQTGPHGCEDCHAFELRYDECVTEDEKRTGWRRGDEVEP